MKTPTLGNRLRSEEVARLKQCIIDREAMIASLVSTQALKSAELKGLQEKHALLRAEVSNLHMEIEELGKWKNLAREQAHFITLQQ